MTDEEDLLPFDSVCPACRGESDPGERFDGEEYRCGNCGRWLVATAWVDNTMSAIQVERQPADDRTGRQRTRSRWRKRGRS